MTKVERVIKTQTDLEAWERYCRSQPFPLTVTAFVGEEPRRKRQNRFAFEAYKQIASILGDRDVEDVRSESKLHIGVPIMRAEDDMFREKYDLRVRPLPYEVKLDLMLEPFDFPVTRIMSVQQMNDYINKMLEHWDKQGAPAMIERYDQ